MSHTVIIYIEPFEKYVRTTKPPVLIHILPNKKRNITNFDVINCNDINNYDQAYDSHGEITVKLSMINTR